MCVGFADGQPDRQHDARGFKGTQRMGICLNGRGCSCKCVSADVSVCVCDGGTDGSEDVEGNFCNLNWIIYYG